MANLNREKLQDELEALGQSHVLARLDALDAAGRERLVAQLTGFDLEMVRSAFEAIGQGRRAALAPPVPVLHPTRGGSERDYLEAEQAGEAELRAGRVGILLVAGGEASRLGRSGPKGCFPIGPVSDRSLFQVFAQQIHGLGRRFGKTPVWMILTSPGNDAETRTFFQAHGHFGLDPAQVIFFSQAEAPCLSADGELVFGAPDRVLTAPDGHGGVIPALGRAGVLERLEDQGVTHLFHHQVDNPLLPVGDPILVGFRVLGEAEIASKVVAKRSAEDRVGTWAEIGGRPQIVEYTEIEEPARSQRSESGELRFWAGSINVHVFGRAFLERMVLDSERALPYHASPKPLQAWGPDGRRVSIQGFKLERFVFDAVPMAEKAILVESLREEEYAPLKNAEGSESVATSRAALSARNHRWLRQAGVEAPRTATVEIDESRYDGPEALRESGLRRIADAGDSILTSVGGLR